MCQTVVINRGEKEVQTVAQFEQYFNTKVEGDDIAYDCCLCQIDVEKELKKLNIPFGYDYCDYYVGQLEEIAEGDHTVEIWQPADTQ